MKIRPMIEFIKNQELYQRKPLVGVEVGVWYGDNALSMLQNLNIEKLYLVDPFKRHHIYSGRLFRQKRMDMVRMLCMEKLKDFSDKTVFIRKKSVSAVKDFSDDSLDFVYIDASHKYSDACKDIRVWKDKVKLLGVFGGHDYSPGVTDGVVMAVDNDRNKSGRHLYVEGSDWWMVR